MCFKNFENWLTIEKFYPKVISVEKNHGRGVIVCLQSFLIPTILSGSLKIYQKVTQKTYLRSISMFQSKIIALNEKS